MNNEIEKAFRDFDNGIRPNGFKEPRRWYVLSDKNKAYPAKGIWALASKAQSTSSFYPPDAKRNLQKHGYTIFDKKNNKSIPSLNGKDKYPFKVGEEYSKKDIYKICKVPTEKQRGNWDTGSTKYIDDWFIFANVGTPGRTGHDYKNRFIGDDLHWYGRTNSRLGQPSIDSLVNPHGFVYIFYRQESKSPFLFAGLAKVKSIQDETPVQITWKFEKSFDQQPEILAEEITNPNEFYEGSTKKISVNIYERNPEARKKCLDHYGLSCSVCAFNFRECFGELGEGFIHVHHLKQLSEIGKEYKLDPIVDLRPVCPNCHAMLHRKNPPLSINQLKQLRVEL